MINLIKPLVQNASLVHNSENCSLKKAYTKTQLNKGVKINCKHSKVDFKEAERKEMINYIRQFGMGDKRNWSEI